MRDICRSDRIAFRSNDRLFLSKTESETKTQNQNNDSIPESNRTDVSQAQNNCLGAIETMGHLGRTLDSVGPAKTRKKKTLPILTANKYCTILESDDEDAPRRSGPGSGGLSL